ncbi:MAG TPA: hypothetical protein DCW60_01845 [Sutterella sp.]|nr:hypothetical protein [Sutterella sp.]
MTFATWSEPYLERFRAVADVALKIHDAAPERLTQAMRYAVLGDGKRLRALLVYAGAEAVGGRLEIADRAAIAIECIHAYSLVHDDLPAMDNDDLRRGKPTTHKAFGEAVALVAGDALQAKAFELLSTSGSPFASDMVSLLALGAGEEGMCGGQTLDMLYTGQTVGERELRQMHAMKTGALIKASVLLGLWTAERKPTIEDLTAYGAFGDALGLLFQVTDDVLDATQTTQTLGKTAGKDAQDAKSTFVTVLGLEASKRAVQDAYLAAVAALDGKPRTTAFLEIARAVKDRTH